MYLTVRYLISSAGQLLLPFIENPIYAAASVPPVSENEEKNVESHWDVWKMPPCFSLRHPQQRVLVVIFSLYNVENVYRKSQNSIIL